MAYETTKVSAMRTWGDINSLLYAHGCMATRQTDHPGKGFTIEFIMPREAEVNGKLIQRRHLVRIPVEYDLSGCNTKIKRGQEVRTRWRSVYYYLKAIFDAIDKNIVIFEQAFLADTVLTLPNGSQQRIIEHLLPDIAQSSSMDSIDFRPMLLSGEEEES